MTYADPTRVVHVQALGPEHTEGWDCRCQPVRSAVDGQAIAVHRTEAVPDPETCHYEGDPCPYRAWSNGYCGPHQPEGPYGRSRKVPKPLDRSAG